MNDVAFNTVDAPVAEIQTALQQIFNSLQGNFTRSMSTNRVLLVAPTTCQQQVDEVIDLLATAQPGRFFVLKRDESAADLSASMSARCQQLSRGQSVCSEVITMRYSNAHEHAIPSVVKAHFLTGRRTELILLDSVPLDSLFEEFSAVADVLLFNTAHYWSDGAFLEGVTNRFSRIIDTQWLLLAPWREAIRSVFDLHIHYRELSHIQEVSIEYYEGLAVPAFLFAGWFIQALDLSVSASTSEGFECTARDGRKISLHLNAGELADSDICGVSSIRFSFADSQTSPLYWTRQGLQIVGSRAPGDDQIFMSQRIDSCSATEAIQRYFSVGESTVRYASALVIALELAQLEQGFARSQE